MEITLQQILLLCAAAFAAGFVDAIVGGGGLIQTPVLLVVLSGHPVVNVIASGKIPSFCGTLLATWQYLKKVRLHFTLVAIMCTVAFFASFAGSEVLSIVSNAFMKPVLLIVLAIVAIYTFARKNFGQKEAKKLLFRQEVIRGVLISLVIGFYDGFIGPGAGSFLILAIISLLGYDFLRASAQAKMVNLATNIGSILLFTLKGKIIWAVALPMAACNSAGGLLGARLALSKGNRFIRIFFLIIVTATLARFAWDVFK